VHETEFVKDTLNPLWRPFELPVTRLNNGEHHQKFKIECWDNSKSGKHTFIGEVECSLSDIFDEKRIEFHLLNKKEVN
jgi:Ca2+-dependent lipid-binding protein